MARKTVPFEDMVVVQVGPMPVLDTAKIPQIVKRDLAACVLREVAEIFQRPEVQEDYLRWKAAREAKRA